ncbi:hypothetical protein L1887_02732 [Cichorium endivia]|nr:hypothetical protein L1887_02732 [Cichorium endivia]
MHRPPPMGMYSLTNSTGGGSNGKPPRTEEDDLKDLEALLNKKSFKELQKSKTGEELLDLIHRPTTCKYVYYELDSTPDVPHMMMGVPGPSKPLKPQRAEYCSEEELGESEYPSIAD